MPTYEYECSHCQHTFEVFQSMLDKRLKKCPKCGRGTLKRLIGRGAGIIFKGSGFYETDYKQKKVSPAKPEAQPPAKTPQTCAHPNACACSKSQKSSKSS